MNTKFGCGIKINNHTSHLLKFFIILLIILSFGIGAHAATVVLKSGATIKGKLIERNDEQIVLQDPATRQNRVIKSIFILSVTLDLDEQKIDEKQQKKKERRVAEEKAVEEGGIISVIQPQVGLMPGVALPVGKIADRIKIGGGFYVFSDVGIPKMPDIFKLRLGLALGFYYHTTSGTDYASSIMHLPLTPYAKFQFIAPYGLKPYLKLGGGIIPVLAGGASDMAPGLVAGVGLGYTHEKIPYLEFFFEAGFMMVFESIRGDYVTINLGAAYRFGVPGPSMK